MRKLTKPQGAIFIDFKLEVCAPANCVSNSIYQFVAPVHQALPENGTRNSDICELGAIGKASVLAIEEDHVAEFQLESSEVLGDAESVESGEEHPFA